MSSLMHLLLETMPFSAVAQSFQDANKAWKNLTASEVRQRVTLLPNDAPFDVELPELNDAVDEESQNLWAFSHGPEEPAAVRSVYCRVRDADYVGHRVASKVAWGLEEEIGSYKPVVRVTFQSGVQMSLPLAPEFVFYKFLLRGGNIVDDHTRLWRLRSVLDTSLVVVFSYDIDPSTGKVLPLDLETISDPALRAEAKDADQALRELLGTPSDNAHESEIEHHTPGEPLPPEPEPLPSPKEEAQSGEAPPPDPWGGRTLKGDFWHPWGEANVPRGSPVSQGSTGEIGGTVEIFTEPARVMIVFSFTTCCERADFEPGGIVGFAKCFPHLLVSTTVGVKKIEASARIDRPHELEKWDEPDRNMNASCCQPGHDGWSPELRSLLVADSNVAGNAGPVPLPSWSNMFDYYLVDPHRIEIGTRFHVVRTDRPSYRESDRPLVEREVIMGFDKAPIDGLPIDDKGIVRKLPRQGEFDNAHMAPRLKLLRVAAVKNKDLIGGAFERFKIEDRSEWALDDIAMAPFCAHDCLHLHWRWSTFGDQKWNLGWDATGPYRKAGAPMVPPSQDVWLFFRADAALTYHVVDQNPSFIDGWCPFMHHGFGYAVAIQSRLKTVAAMVAIDLLGSRFTFVDEDGLTVTAIDSTAAYYWWARHNVEVNSGQPFVYDRLHWRSAADLQEAREL